MKIVLRVVIISLLFPISLLMIFSNWICSGEDFMTEFKDFYRDFSLNGRW